LAIPIATIRRFGDNEGGRQAALIAYYSFFSLFPAMLAMVTILGFVLQGHDQLRQDIADSALAQFPIVGDQIASSTSVSSPLSGNGFALAIGLFGALWAGLGAMQAAQDAMNHVWNVKHDKNPSFFAKRLRSLVMLVVIGVLVVTSTTLAQLAGQLVPGVLASIALTVASAAWNVGVFALAYRILTVRDVTWREALPGAVFTGVIYTALQLFGGVYVAHVLNGASNTYGTFAVVIGLLSWIFLIAQVFVIGGELNVVVARHEWPRPLRKARRAA
jgi:YihY family inner membrane protein